MKIYDRVLSGVDKNNLSLTTFDSQYTAGDLQDAVSRYEAMLRPLSIEGKRVALLVPAIQDFFPLFLAVNKLGGVVAPLSWQFRKEDLLNVLNFLNPHVVFTVNNHTGFDFSEVVTGWASSIDDQTIVYTSDDCSIWEHISFEGKEKELETILGGLITFSSGSTGTPKGMIFSEDMLDFGCYSVLDTFEHKSTDNVFVYASTSGVYGLYNLHSTVKEGANLLVADQFDMVSIVNLMKEAKCNKFITTPSVFKAIYTFASRLSPEVLKTLELVGVAGEKLPDNWVESFPLMEKCKFVSLFGSSESGSLAKVTVQKGTKDPEYKLLDGAQAKVVDGELYARSGAMFLGYYKNPQLTQESLEYGWFKAGDLVEFPDNETFKIVGRKKDIIKKGGQQVVPSEVEQLIATLKEVRSVVVVGAPHSIYGEQVIAFVVADGLEASDIRTFCSGKISTYKLPDRVIFIDEIPLTQGKIDKPKLRSMVI